MEDIGESVSVSGRVYALWCVHCLRTVARLADNRSVRLEDIVDEIIIHHPSLPGYLQIVVDLGDGRLVTMDIPPTDWAWSDGRN